MYCRYVLQNNIRFVMWFNDENSGLPDYGVFFLVFNFIQTYYLQIQYRFMLAEQEQIITHHQ